MVLVKLFCAVVGEESVVGVDIEDQQAVVDLKERIKRRAGYDFPSHKLTLYRAKLDSVADGAWMTTAHPDYVRLSRGDAGAEAIYLTTGMLLDPTWSIEDYFDVSDKNFPKKKAIHVLVKLPDDRSTAINVPGEQTNLLGHRGTETLKTKVGALKYLFWMALVVFVLGTLTYIGFLCGGVFGVKKERLKDLGDFFYFLTVAFASIGGLLYCKE